MKVNHPKIEKFKMSLWLLTLLFITLLSGIVHADLPKAHDGRPKLCHDEGQDPIQGVDRDVQSLAEKACADLNTAHDSSETCKQTQEECVKQFKISFWENVQRHHEANGCVFRFEPYFRCSPCVYQEILEEVASQERGPVEQGCHCGNGEVDGEEACDPKSPTPLAQNLQCSSRCTLIVVDPVQPDLPEAPVRPDSEAPIVTPNETGQSGGSAPAVGGCSLTLTPIPSSLFSTVGLFLPLILFRMIKKQK